MVIIAPVSKASPHLASWKVCLLIGIMEIVQSEVMQIVHSLLDTDVGLDSPLMESGLSFSRRC